MFTPWSFEICTITLPRYNRRSYHCLPRRSSPFCTLVSLEECKDVFWRSLLTTATQKKNMKNLLWFYLFCLAEMVPRCCVRTLAHASSEVQSGGTCVTFRGRCSICWSSCVTFGYAMVNPCIQVVCSVYCEGPRKTFASCVRLIVRDYPFSHISGRMWRKGENIRLLRAGPLWHANMQSELYMGDVCGEDYEIYDAGSSRTLGHHSLTTPKQIYQQEAHQSAYKTLGSPAWNGNLCPKYLEFILMAIVRELYGKTCIGCRSVCLHGCNCKCCCLTEWSIHLHTLKITYK